jgi:hypothetical protein
MKHQGAEHRQLVMEASRPSVRWAPLVLPSWTFSEDPERLAVAGAFVAPIEP